MKLENVLKAQGVCVSDRGGGDWRPKSLAKMAEKDKELRRELRRIEQSFLELAARVSSLEDVRRRK